MAGAIPFGDLCVISWRYRANDTPFGVNASEMRHTPTSDLNTIIDMLEEYAIFMCNRSLIVALA